MPSSPPAARPLRRGGPFVAVLALLLALTPAATAQEESRVASAELIGVDGQTLGVTVFVEAPGGGLAVATTVERGVEPVGQLHGLHVHENGVCDADSPDGAFMSAGPHHAGEGAAHPDHDGDLPLLYVREDGRGEGATTTTRLDLDEVVGKGVIVHAGADNLANIPDERYDAVDGGPVPDEETLGAGDSGGRVACGVVQQGPPSPDALPAAPSAQPLVASELVELRDPADQPRGDAAFLFTETASAAVAAQVTGLQPVDDFHGWHVHAGDRCRFDAATPDFDYALGHLGHDLGAVDHGDHPGDFPVLLATETGTAVSAFSTDRLDPATLRGKAVVVHEGRDNHANIPADRYTSPTGEVPDGTTRENGDAGGRLLCGETEGAVRLAGDDRVGTSIAVSQNSFLPESATAVVLARADRFPDALAGTPLAVEVGAPILLTGTDILDPRVEEEIARAMGEGGTVHLLGGEDALSPAVEARLTQLGYDAPRVAGADRFGTAAAVLDTLGDVERILVTTGYRFPDALAAGAVAAAADGAVLFSAGDAPSPATDAAIAASGAGEVVAVGGPAAVAYPAVEAVVGSDRNATAVAVAERFVPDARYVGLARQGADGTDTDAGFADALAGGVHVGRLGGPVLLTGTSELDVRTAEYLRGDAEAVVRTYAYGGPSALTDAVVGQAEAEAATAPALPVAPPPAG